MSRGVVGTHQDSLSVSPGIQIVARGRSTWPEAKLDRNVKGDFLLSINSMAMPLVTNGIWRRAMHGLMAIDTAPERLPRMAVLHFHSQPTGEPQ